MTEGTGADSGANDSDPALPGSDEPGPDPFRPVRRLATALAVLVGVNSVLGVVALVMVPFGRPTGWISTGGRAVYLVHAVTGLPLAAGAVVLLVETQGAGRILSLSARIGAGGVAIAGAGGLFALTEPTRLLGAACMLVGPVVAAFGYLLPTFDALEDAPG